MKLNISYPLNGSQKCIEVDDDKKIAHFMDRHMGTEIEGDFLGDNFKGYLFKITGGNDKDGFPMRQGVKVKGRVRLLLDKNQKTYRPRRNGERKRKSVRGCIVSHDICVLALSIIKKGPTEIEGLTNVSLPRRLGPKRVSYIRKLFGLTVKDGSTLVRKNAIRRTWTTAAGKNRQKAPKVQRLVTSARLRRKKIYKALKKSRWETSRQKHAEYDKLLKDTKKRHDDEAKRKVEEAHKKVEKPVEKPATGKGAPSKGTAATGKAATQATKTTAASKTAPTKVVEQPKKGGAKEQAAPKKTETKPATQPTKTAQPQKTQAAAGKDQKAKK
jgi:small subunit ribosomal protein S6e